MAAQSTQVFPTNLEYQGKGYVDYVRRFEVTPASLTAGAYKIPVNAGEIILGVRVQIVTAWDGSASCDVGDGSAAAGFIGTANLTEATIGSYYNSVGGAGTYAQGKVYTTVGALIVAIGGTPTVGKMIVSVVYDGYGTGPDPRREIKNLTA